MDPKTIRDEFAGQAMQAIITAYESADPANAVCVNAKGKGLYEADDVAGRAYDIADAMMRARSKPTEQPEQRR